MFLITYSVSAILESNLLEYSDNITYEKTSYADQVI